MIMDQTIIFLRNNKFQFQIINKNYTIKSRNIGINLDQYITFWVKTYLIRLLYYNLTAL